MKDFRAFEVVLLISFGAFFGFLATSGYAAENKHIFFDAQAFWGGVVAGLGALFAAYRFYLMQRSNEFIAANQLAADETRFAEEVLSKKLLIAEAISAEIAMNIPLMSGYTKFSRQELIQLLGTRRPLRETIFGYQESYDAHKANLGLLGARIASWVNRAYFTKNKLLWTVESTASENVNWDDWNEAPMETLIERHHCNLIQGLKILIKFLEQHVSADEVEWLVNICKSNEIEYQLINDTVNLIEA